jgi:hypothetical protein
VISPDGRGREPNVGATPASPVGRVTTTTPASETVAHAQARWARTRAGGRRAFVWRYGVASWGLPAGALTTVYRILRMRASTPGMALSVAAVRPVWLSIVAVFTVCGVVGYLLGAWLWDYCEARFGS